MINIKLCYGGELKTTVLLITWNISDASLMFKVYGRSLVPRFINLINIKHRNLHTSFTYHNQSSQSKDAVVYQSFESINNKSKKTYLEMLNIFGSRDVHRRGHVEFIYSALKNMENFGVHKDVEVYKALIDVLPKGKFIPTNIFQAEFMHYPKQQQCAIDLLEQMEDNGVMPDYEMEAILLNIFGRRGYPLRKFWRMMYWMPKFKNASPWPLPNDIPDDTLELAKLAVERMGSVDIQTKSTIYRAADIQGAIEDTWIVSAQSVSQKALLDEHNSDSPIYIEGPFRIWIKNKGVDYFVLKGDPRPIPKDDYDSDDVSNINTLNFGFTFPKKKSVAIVPSVHEQEDGIIFSICVTGTSSPDSLLSWIRHLEADGNPKIANIPVVFTIRVPEKEVTVCEDSKDNSAEKA